MAIGKLLPANCFNVYSFLKYFVKILLPKRLSLNSEPLLRKFISVFYSGIKYECPVCGFHARKFLVVHNGESKLCPSCGSIERKRLLWLYLNDEIKIQEKNNLKVLHFSPSIAIFRKLKAMDNINYFPTDFYNPLIKNHFDITSLPFEEKYFDLIICYHILEHVSDDRKAMNELFRVLNFSGALLTQVPYSENETHEDSSITNPAERKKIFGQEDHVRYYGRSDFKTRLENSGFQVSEIKYAAKIGNEKSEKYQLNSNETIFCCTNN
ncbi:MAG: methyltransferase domain-containing protein [Bacteroidia bacterium]|nr:methyltransferase domain-containing protein [Bacteroidia bacterium]